MKNKRMNDKERYNLICETLKEMNLATIDFTFDYFVKNKGKSYRDVNIMFKCKECGENFTRTFANMIKKDRRKVCLKCCKAQKKTKLLTLEDIRERVLKKGLNLVSDEYKGETFPIFVMCGCGEVYSTTYASIRNSGKNGICRCKECAKEYNRNYFRMSFNDVREYFDKENCVLLSNEKEYVNIFSQLKFIATCGHEHTATFQSFKNSKLKMCKECTKQVNSGENAYNWSGGYDSESIRFRKTYEFKKWIKDVYKRDEFTCQRCKSVGGKLNAHHLNGYNWDIENRTNINNGITLCEECHKDFHDTYGRGDNTKEQFEEWICSNS